MSYSVQGTTVTLTRGDTFNAEISLTDRETGEPYSLTSNDSIRFALKHKSMTRNRGNYTDKNPLILKQISVDTMTLNILPADTKNLEFGTYVYDIEVQFEDGTVETVIDTADFNITPEVD